MSRRLHFLAILAGVAICLSPMPALFASAEVDTFYNDPDSQDLKTIECGDYTYSVMVGVEDNTQRAACIESYSGKDEALVIPDKLDGLDVVSVGDRAFSGNHAIKSIHIPAALLGTGLYSFAGCTSLTEFTVDEKNEYYAAIDGVLYAEDGGYLVQYPIGKQPVTVEIPDGVYDIGNSAFTEIQTLQEVKLPSTVKSIGVWAFSNCPSLTKINLPSSITQLEDFCFANDTALTISSIPDHITSIGAGTFSGCSAIKEFTIPNTVTSIGQAAFAGTGLKEITIPATVTEIGYNAVGYKLNSQRDLVMDAGFVIRGQSGSAAESYAKDKENGNNFTFETVSAQTDVTLGLVEIEKSTGTQTAPPSDKKDDAFSGGLKTILFFAIGGTVLLIGVLLSVLSVRKKKQSASTNDSTPDQPAQKDE